MTAERLPAVALAEESPLRGIALKVASTLALTLMLVLVKLVSTRFPIGQLVFCRTFFGLLPVFAWAAYEGRLRTVFRTANHFGQLGRAAAGTAAVFLNLAALSFLPVADAVAFNYAIPLLTVALAVPLLGERLDPYRGLAVAAGFLGILIILSGHLGDGAARADADLGAMLAAAGAVFGALAVLQLRALARTEPATTIVVYFSSITAVAGLATLPFGWEVPDAGEAAALVGSGVLGGIGQVLLTESYRHGAVSLIAPFEYSSMVWALAAGWLVFAAAPTATMLLGSSVVIAAGLFVLGRENRSRVRR